MVSCLGQGKKMSNFVSNRVTGFEGFSDTPLLKLQLKSPPLPPLAPEYTNQKMNNGVRGERSAYERGGDAHRLA